jgi:hypothetical protein
MANNGMGSEMSQHVNALGVKKKVGWKRTVDYASVMMRDTL